MSSEPRFTLGVEEELLIVDARTLDLVPEVPDAVVSACRSRLGEHAKHELMQCQVEITSEVCESAGELRDQLATARAVVGEVADEHGLALIASASHPFARPTLQELTAGEHYRLLAGELRELVTDHFVICGMHVHVGIEDPELRVALMNEARLVLPLVLALSASSPFWDGHDTGLHSYRTAVWDAVPRTGVPPTLASYGEHQALMDRLVPTGLIEDEKRIWWDLRLSPSQPTLECRLADVTPSVDDAVAIACLLRCFLRRAWRLGSERRSWASYEPALVAENRWLAQRDGVAARQLDLESGEVIPLRTSLATLVAELAEDAAHFGCEAELAHAETIAREGSSADRQRAARDAALAEGADARSSLMAVATTLARETRSSAGPPGRTAAA